jgi:TonB-linked SusC/RagA family outer membrane protein
MENNPNVNFSYILKRVNIILLRIKLLTILIFVGAFAVHAATNEQRTKINLKVDNISLKEVLSTIEKNSDYIFIYNGNIFNSNLKKSISVQDESILNVLNIIFKGIDVTYKIDGMQVFIYKKDEVKKNETIDKKKGIELSKKKRITGKVTDEKGETILGATVMVKGTGFGTITNVDGGFSLEVPEETKIITVSYVGYTAREVVLGNQTVFKVVLEDANLGIQEVVVVGYGFQKKESVVGAISQVGTEALVRSGTGNITNAIAGKLSGVLTIQQSGQPGSNGSEIIIRGLSSWNGSAPLVLVDGVERDFSNLDPNEINTVSVLKDASATAVFGAKGANGVLIVTTKRGTLGKPKLNISVSTGFEKPTSLPQHISSFDTYSALNVAYRNKGGEFFAKLTPQNVLNEYQNPSTRLNSIRYPNNDWISMLTNDYAPSTQANINIGGGTKFVKYFASFGYLHEGDFFKGYNEGFDDTRYKNDKINYRANLDFSITSSTEISFNIGGDIQITNGHKEDPWQMLYGSAPGTTPAFFPDWVLQEVPDLNYPNASGMRYATNSDYFKNPYNTFFSGSYNKSLTSKLFTDVMLNQKLDFITKGLVFKSKVSLSTSFKNLVSTADYNFDNYSIVWANVGTNVNPWVRAGETEEVKTQLPLNINAAGGMQGAYYTDLYYEFALQYNRSFRKHSVSALALINYQQKNKSNASTPVVEFPYYNAGVVGRVTYDFASKYLLEMNLGYTGSERFAPKNRFGLFPSVAAGWVVSEENFFKSAFPVIDKLKIRYSDGLVGSDNASERWLYMSSYKVSGSNIVVDKTANPDAQWEEARKRDLGFELGIFKNQLRLSVDLYDEFRDKMLLTPNNLNSTTSGQFKQMNLGSMKKHGFELELEFNKTVSSKFNYFLKGNFGFNENRVLFKDDLISKLEHLKEAGKPYGGQIQGLQLNGNEYFTSIDDIHLNPSPVALTSTNVGDYQYLDFTADGTLTKDDKHSINGFSYPPITYSFSTGFTYKGFDFNLMLQGNAGKYVDFNSAFENEFLKGNLRLHTSQMDYWSPTNLDANHATLNFAGATDEAKLAWAGGTSDVAGYDGKLEGRVWRNADYIRLKEIYMGYNINSKMLKKSVGISNVLIYATGNNLITFTKLIEGDPERKDFFLGFYPQMLSAKLGLKFSF